MEQIKITSGTTFPGRGGRPRLGKRRASKLNYEPTERQALFHSCDAEVTLYGGAVGGGKSLAILMEGFISMIEQPGSHGILLRRTFPELESSLILMSLRLFPQDICRYNSLKHSWIIQTSGPESVLDFGYARTLEEAIERYRSSEFNFLGFDELTHFEKSIFAELISRTRTSIEGATCRIVAASNPGNVGHQWVKEYFGIGTVAPETIFKPEPSEDDPAPLSRCFIPAKITDNPHLMKADPGYIRRLSLLPQAQRKMLRDGDWSVPEGRFFNELKEAHFIEPRLIEKHWTCYRSIDYGFTAPFCCLWIAAASDGHFYVYRESYVAGLRDIEQAALVVQLSQEPVEYTTGDPSMGSKNSSGISALENYMLAGVPIIRADNERIPGWMAVRNLLAPHTDGTPILRIFNTCPNLRRELENAIYDTKSPDDLNTKGSDHALDALRYWARSRPLTPQQPQNDPLRHLDPESRAEWEAIAKRRQEKQNPHPLDELHDSGFQEYDEPEFF